MFLSEHCLCLRLCTECNFDQSKTINLCKQIVRPLSSKVTKIAIVNISIKHRIPYINVNSLKNSYAKINIIWTLKNIIVHPRPYQQLNYRDA